AMDERCTVRGVLDHQRMKCVGEQRIPDSGENVAAWHEIGRKLWNVLRFARGGDGLPKNPDELIECCILRPRLPKVRTVVSSEFIGDQCVVVASHLRGDSIEACSQSQDWNDHLRYQLCIVPLGSDIL